MDSRTQKLTFGAMIIAIFGVILVLNRQTGGFFEEMFFFILPLPMTVFSLRYGWKDSLSVFVCMGILSFFFGTPYTIYYAVTSAFLGIVLGTCLKVRMDLNKTQLLIMVLSAVFSVVGAVVLAALFGIDLNMELDEIQNMMSRFFAGYGFNSADPQSAAAMPGLETLLSRASLKRMYVISMVLLGVMQGFIVFRLSLLILKRLQVPVPQPQPIGLYYPPRWSGWAALLLFFLYTYSMARPLVSENLQNILQTAGLCGYLYLLCFGWVSVSFLIRRLIAGSIGRILSAVIALFLLLAMPMMFLILGFFYISTPFHDYLLGKTG